MFVWRLVSHTYARGKVPNFARASNEWCYSIRYQDTILDCHICSVTGQSHIYKGKSSKFYWRNEWYYSIRYRYTLLDEANSRDLEWEHATMLWMHFTSCNTIVSHFLGHEDDTNIVFEWKNSNIFVSLKEKELSDFWKRKRAWGGLATGSVEVYRPFRMRSD